MKIISADERLNSPRGLKILIAGPTGVGKTSLLRTVDPRSVLLLLEVIDQLLEMADKDDVLGAGILALASPASARTRPSRSRRSWSA
jgi:hypothetical protein